MPAQPIYQFNAELCDYKPKIWRRFQVVSNITMARLGYILMSMYEMQASHLFSFCVPAEDNFQRAMRERLTEAEFTKLRVGETAHKDGRKNRRYAIINEDTLDYADEKEELFDATQRKVKDAVFYVNERMNFEYDYGDNWQVALTLEKVIVDKELSGKELPRVLEGQGYGIIEDCGGVGGLTELAAAFKKKKGTAYNEFREWLGVDQLDLTAFDIDDANYRLKKVPRIYADIYEHHLAPTKRSMDLLERRYLEES